MKDTRHKRFTQLITALDTGWEIEQPVLIGATWHATTKETSMYHFILRKKADDKKMLLSLPLSAQLLTFLATNHITITQLQGR